MYCWTCHVSGGGPKWGGLRRRQGFVTVCTLCDLTKRRCFFSTHSQKCEASGRNEGRTFLISGELVNRLETHINARKSLMKQIFLKQRQHSCSDKIRTFKWNPQTSSELLAVSCKMHAARCENKTRQTTFCIPKLRQNAELSLDTKGQQSCWPWNWKNVDKLRRRFVCEIQFQQRRRGSNCCVSGIKARTKALIM